MSNRAVSFLITAKDNASAVFGRFKTMLGGLKNAIGGLFSRLTTLPALIGIGSVTAAITKSVQASMESEDSNRRLAAALARVGANSKATFTELDKLASSLQAVTGVEDEAIKNAMALGLQYGIAPDKIGAVTEAALGLANVYGVDLNSAMMGFGRNAAGVTARLAMYGIKVDETMSREQIHAELMKRGAAGYKQLSDQMDSTGGSFRRLKVGIGELMERFGDAISKGLGLKGLFDQIKQRIDTMEFTQLQERLAVLKGVIRNLFSGDEGERSQAMKDMGAVVKAAFTDAMSGAVRFLKSAAPVIGGLIGSAAKAIITEPNARDRRMEAERALVAEGKGDLIGGAQKMRYGMFGKDADEYRAKNPEIARIIDDKMAELQRKRVEESGRAYMTPDNGDSELDKVMAEIKARQPVKDDYWEKRDAEETADPARSDTAPVSVTPIDGLNLGGPLSPGEVPSGVLDAVWKKSMANFKPSDFASALVENDPLLKLAVGSVKNALPSMEPPAPQYGPVGTEADRLPEPEPTPEAAPVEEPNVMLAKPTTSEIGLGEAFDIGRGQDTDSMAKLVDRAGRTNELLAKIASAEGVR